MDTTPRRTVTAPGLYSPTGPLSHAVRYRDLVFVSGCAPLDEDFGLVAAGDPAGQARQAFAVMERVLAASGSSLADVLQLTIYLTAIEDRAAILPVRRELFAAVQPATTVVGVAALAVPGMCIEAEAIAAAPDPLPA